MKKIIFILTFCFIFLFFIHSDEMSDLLKNNINKVVNVYLSNYVPSPMRCIIGTIVSVSDNILIISIGKNSEPVFNDAGKSFTGKMYIKISEIAAIKIADEK